MADTQPDPSLADPSLPRPTIKVPRFPPPHLLLWPGHPRGSALWRLRRAYRICWWRRFNADAFWRLVTGMLAWPLVAVALAVYETKVSGLRWRRQTGIGLFHQFLAHLRFALCHRIVPKYYYIFELQRPELGRRAAEYLTRVETKGGVYRALKQRGDRSKIVRINDKLTFSAFYGQQGLRVVPVVAAYRHGERIPEIGAGELPQGGDLFVKMVEGRGGIGAESWLAQPDGSYRSSRGQQRSLAELKSHVAELSRQGDYLIQPRLLNHAGIVDLTPGALSTVRLLTILNEAGEPEAVNAAFRMAMSAASPVDNFHAGGIASAVDIATGRLGAATGLGLGGDFSWHDRHPTTGATILGRMLPDWPETLALALAAHRLVRPRVMVGWDIGFLADGPCLVEGNVGPDADIHQRTELRPIGNGRYGELLAFHLERRLGLTAEK